MLTRSRSKLFRRQLLRDHACTLPQCPRQSETNEGENDRAPPPGAGNHDGADPTAMRAWTLLLLATSALPGCGATPPPPTVPEPAPEPEVVDESRCTSLRSPVFFAFRYG